MSLTARQIRVIVRMFSWWFLLWWLVGWGFVDYETNSLLAFSFVCAMATCFWTLIVALAAGILG